MIRGYFLKNTYCFKPMALNYILNKIQPLPSAIVEVDFYHMFNKKKLMFLKCFLCYKYVSGKNNNNVKFLSFNFITQKLNNC